MSIEGMSQHMHAPTCTHTHTHTHTHTKEGRLISSRRVLSSIISSPLSIKQTSVATGNKKYRLYRINPGKVTKQIVITTKTGLKNN